MFLASILFCAAVSPGVPDLNNCFALGDTRGPYLTEQQCQARLEELEFILQTTPIIINFVASELNNPVSMVSTSVCTFDNSEIEL